MKKIVLILFASVLLSCAIRAQNDSKLGIDIYPIPMLLGEYGFQLNLPPGIGAHFTYYNPALGLTGILINSQLGEGDELDLNVNSYIPGVSYTHYSKSGFEGFYVGGKVMYKTASGTVLLKDKYTGGSAYKAIVEADINLNTLNVSVVSGYRFVFDSNFAIRLGAALGYQNCFTNDVIYEIIEEYEDGSGDEVIDDMKTDVETYTKSFTKSITFQVEIGLGFNF